MDADSLYGKIQPRLRIATFLFLPLHKLWLYTDHLLCSYFPLNGFKAGFSYTAEPVIIIRFGDVVAGTPADNAHASRAALAVPDLCSSFLETALLSHNGCF